MYVGTVIRDHDHNNDIYIGTYIGRRVRLSFLEELSWKQPIPNRKPSFGDSFTFILWRHSHIWFINQQVRIGIEHGETQAAF